MALGRKPISFDENPLPPTTADPSNPGTPGLGFGPTLPDGTPNPNWTPPPTQPVTFGYGPGQFPGPQNGGQGFTPDVGGDGQQPQVNVDPVGRGGPALRCLPASAARGRFRPQCGVLWPPGHQRKHGLAQSTATHDHLDQRESRNAAIGPAGYGPTGIAGRAAGLPGERDGADPIAATAHGR